MYQWERFAQQFEQLGTRVVIGGFGIILSNEGGALQTNYHADASLVVN